MQRGEAKWGGIYVYNGRGAKLWVIRVDYRGCMHYSCASGDEWTYLARLVLTLHVAGLQLVGSYETGRRVSGSSPHVTIGVQYCVHVISYLEGLSSHPTQIPEQ
jgi:hypothetical protein